MSCLGQCRPERPLSMLLCPDPAHARASLDSLNRSVQRSRQRLVDEIVKSDETESYINALGRLLGSTDSRLCGMAAYLLGVLVEREDVMKVLQTRVPEDDDSSRNNLVGALGQLLTGDDPNVVTNAAAAIASLAASPVGRDWLLDPLVSGRVLTALSVLLSQGRDDDAVNSAALTLARLSHGEAACRAMLSHPSAPDTLTCLVQCLANSHTDTAMNAAFAVGRLCGSERGRSLVLAAAEEFQLVHSLRGLMSEVAGPEAGQTACFALSCLATEEDGHALVLASPALPSLLDGILQCLQTRDQDCAWFAAMAVKVFLSRPSGVLHVREHGSLEKQLQFLSRSPSIGRELGEEVDACLRRLERLAKPPPPAARRLASGTYTVSWEKGLPESGLEVTYSLLNNEAVVYEGPLCHVTLPVSLLKPGEELSLSLVHLTRDGDTSLRSEPLLLAVESEEGGGARLGPPRKLRVIGCTASRVRLGWAASAGEPKPRAYQLFRGGALIDTTTNLGAIVGGLRPDTLYQLGVRAVGPGDEAGPCEEVEARTLEARDHAPSGLTMVVLGRHELRVLWGAPATPLGWLFNYELRMNGRVAYLGTERAHTARRLAADTPYTCTVTAVTSRGRCQNRPVTKRTARDEYAHTPRCLYLPTRQPAPPTPPSEAPEVNPKVTEVREKVKKSHSARDHLPKIHLSTRRHRKPLVSTPSPGSKSNRAELSERSMGQGRGVTPWRRDRGRAGLSGGPAGVPDQPLPQLQDRTEERGSVMTQSVMTQMTQSDPVMTQSDPVMTQSVMTQSGPVLTQSGPVLTQSGPVLTQSGPVLTQSGPVLTQSGPVMTQSGPIMTQSGPVMTQSGPVLTQSGPVLTQSGPIMTQSGPVMTHVMLTQSGPVLTQSGPVLTQMSQSGPVLTQSVMTQSVLTQSGPVMMTQSGPVLTQSGPIMTQSGPVMTHVMLTQSGPVLTQSGPVLTQMSQSGPVLTQSVMTQSVLTQSGPVMMTQSGPVMTQSGPVLTQAGPVLTQSGPVMTQSGPVLTQSGLVMSQSGPVMMTQSGPVLTQSGPVLTQSGPVLTQSGPVLTQMTQSGPVLTHVMMTQSGPVMMTQALQPPCPRARLSPGFDRTKAEKEQDSS